MILINKFNYLAFITAALLSVLSFNSTANASQEEFESLIYAIENDDFEGFQKLLQSGANPNFIGEEMGSPIRWVNCSAARLRPLKWIKALEEHGAYMSHLRTDFASDPGDAKYASALLCSFQSRGMETFIYLMNSNRNPVLDLCHLCKNTVYRYSILEYAIRSRKYEKAVWLLENTDYAKNMISERMLNLMNKSAGIRKDKQQHFWKAVDIVRGLGHAVTPAIKR